MIAIFNWISLPTFVLKDRGSFSLLSKNPWCEGRTTNKDGSSTGKLQGQTEQCHWFLFFCLLQRPAFDYVSLCVDSVLRDQSKKAWINQKTKEVSSESCIMNFRLEQPQYKWVASSLDLQGMQPLRCLSQVLTLIMSPVESWGSSYGSSWEEPPLLSPWTVKEPWEMNFNKVLNCSMWNTSTSFLSAKRWAYFI